MRLIHAVRDLSARDRDAGSRRSPCTPTPTAPPRSSARPTWPTRSAPPRPARTSTTPCWSGRWSRPGPTPPGSAGDSSPRTRRSPSCARRSASPSSGPSAEAMRKLGDKIGAKLIAEEVGVPVAPWSRGAVADPGRRAARRRDEIGYPLMLKATAGGGGRGIRMVTSAERPRRGVTSAPAPRRCARSAAASCSSSAWSPAPGTSRSRSSPTARARRGRSASATARCSGATRRSSRSPPRRSWRRSRPRS